MQKQAPCLMFQRIDLPTSLHGRSITVRPKRPLGGEYSRACSGRIHRTDCSDRCFCQWTCLRRGHRRRMLPLHLLCRASMLSERGEGTGDNCPSHHARNRCGGRQPALPRQRQAQGNQARLRPCALPWGQTTVGSFCGNHPGIQVWAKKRRRDAGELRNLPNVFGWDRLPLRNCGWIEAKGFGQQTLLSPVSLEICEQLFHAPIFSQNEIQSREIFQSGGILAILPSG